LTQAGKNRGSRGRAKRIAFLSTSAISLNQLMRGQLEFLRSQGVEIDLYCGGPDDELQTLRERKIGLVRHVPFRRQPDPLWDLICLAWLTILLGLRRYDAVVYSTPKALLLGSLAAFMTAQPRRIAWIRGRGYENFRGRKRRLYEAFDRLTFLLSHEVLFVSPSLKAAYAADGIDAGPKAQVVEHGSSNGVDLERFRPLPPKERAALRSELGLLPEAFVIAVVGRVRPDKGAAEVFELARRMRDLPALKFLMVGRIEDEIIRRQLPRQDKDRLRWFAPTFAVERFFQAADLHLFLSHREGFGNVAIEAAATGLPTFGFSVVGLRDSIIDGATGRLFAFGDLDSVEAAIRAAAADREKLKRDFAHARKVVAERFSQPKVWQSHADIFLDERKGPADAGLTGPAAAAKRRGQA
jgi:glycosyltransferase involved in cell wall biosynthesis